MNVVSRIFALALSILFISILFAFQSNEKPSNAIKKAFEKDYKSFYDNIELLKNGIESKTDEQVIEEYLELRKSYKNIELFLAHIDPEFVKVYVNSAPLPRLGQFDNYPDSVHPEGLQVIDEVVFNDQLNKGSVKYYLEKLSKRVKTFRHFVFQSYFTDRIVLESIRFDLIRVYTLGLTGFDTPGSVNVINDAVNSLSAQRKALKSYYELVDDKSLLETDEMYSNLISVISKSTFENIDRLQILKDYFDPIFKNVLLIHEDIGYEKYKDVDPYPRPFNYDATSIFDENLLNPFFYAQQKNDETFEKKAELGKLLFYDPILSSNNERTCAGCHAPNLAFADGKKTSRAINEDQTISRNSPTLLNSVYSNAYFYDLRAKQLDLQIEHVIFNEKEFDTNWDQIFKKLSSSNQYIDLFAEAFPNSNNGEITAQNLKKALSNYLITLKSFNSKFDKFVKGVEGVDFSEAERNGYNLFMGKAACGTCHFAPVFNGNVPPYYNDSESEVLGVPLNADFDNPIEDKDPGRFDGALLEGHPMYYRSFKTVTVRNVELTAPYMHNGVYNTLDEVMKFYNIGGGQGLGFNFDNQTLPFDSLSLSDKELSDIIAFMKTLNDTTGLTSIPKSLPKIDKIPELNDRLVGGVY